jgi:hypothetical protein
VQRPQPFGSQANLLLTFFARYIKGGEVGEAKGQLKQQG